MNVSVLTMIGFIGWKSAIRRIRVLSFIVMMIARALVLLDCFVVSMRKHDLAHAVTIAFMGVSWRCRHNAEVRHCDHEETDKGASNLSHFSVFNAAFVTKC